MTINPYSKFALLNSLFGAVNLTKDGDPDKNSYSGYGIGFDTCGTFSLSYDSGFGKHVVKFGVSDTSLVYADNRKSNTTLASFLHSVQRGINLPLENYPPLTGQPPLKMKIF